MAFSKDVQVGCETTASHTLLVGITYSEFCCRHRHISPLNQMVWRYW
jgi:hypothetical protein